MNVLLVSTGRLPASYFRKVREELGADPDLVIDTLAWSPPREPVDQVVRRYLLIGPGRMPTVAAQQDSLSASAQQVPTRHASAPHPASGTEPSSAPESRSRRLRRLARIRAGVRRRLNRVVTSRTRRRIRKVVLGGPPRQFWRRVRNNAAAQALVVEAGLVVVLDAGGIRTGWHLARRYRETPVVFGLPAAALHVQNRCHGLTTS
jgi:hypothetical protein